MTGTSKSNVNALLVPVVIGLCLISIVVGEETDPGRRLSARLERMLEAMVETRYQARTEIDENAGSLRCDCSGLLGYVLRHDFPEAYLSLKGEESPWRSRPYSVTYYETFVRAGEEGGVGEWRRVRRMMDVRPGDVLAWRKDTIERNVSTGHTCMIGGMPEKEADGRVRVRVIDSTRKPHAGDTRSPGTNGVGAGEMWFIVNDAGEPIGFFVDDGGVQAKSTKVAIGRLVGRDGRTSDRASTDAGAGSGRDARDGKFLGLDRAAASALAEAKKLAWRVIDEDGAVTPVTMGMREDRVNFVVEKGRVVRVKRG